MERFSDYGSFSSIEERIECGATLKMVDISSDITFGEKKIFYIEKYDMSYYNNNIPSKYIIFNTDRNCPTLIVKNVDDISIRTSVSVDIWRWDIDYWFQYKVRPNRIYISDFSGFKIYDFELNLLYSKEINNENINNNDDVDVYGFEVDKHNWDKFWIWSANESKIILGTSAVLMTLPTACSTFSVSVARIRRSSL